MTMTATISAAGQSIDMKGSGDYLNHPAKGAFAFSMSGMGQNLTYTMVQDGTTMYVSSPLLDSRLPTGKKWMKIDLAKLGRAKGIDFQSLMSRSPAQALQQLEAAGSVKNELMKVAFKIWRYDAATGERRSRSTRSTRPKRRRSSTCLDIARTVTTARSRTARAAA